MLLASDICYCPDCRVNLITKKDSFRAYSRVVGVEVPGLYWGVLYWRCPDCGFCWHRWPPETAWFNAAGQHIYRENKARLKRGRSDS